MILFRKLRLDPALLLFIQFRFDQQRLQFILQVLLTQLKLGLAGLVEQRDGRTVCNGSALIKAVVRGRAWFEELATGRVRSLEELAKRDGITRRYIRRLVDLAFLSPLLVERSCKAGTPSRSPRHV